jgi:hypothetical protein
MDMHACVGSVAVNFDVLTSVREPQVPPYGMRDCVPLWLYPYPWRCASSLTLVPLVDFFPSASPHPRAIRLACADALPF